MQNLDNHEIKLYMCNVKFWHTYNTIRTSHSLESLALKDIISLVKSPQTALIWGNLSIRGERKQVVLFSNYKYNQ